MARPAASGRPFNAHFADVATQQACALPAFHGGEDAQKYIIESTRVRLCIHRL